MDKVLRRFGLQSQVESSDESQIEFLVMDSYVPNDFGNVVIRSICELNGSHIEQVVMEASGSPLTEIFNARLSELQYFLKILPLFNPQVKIDYGLQTQTPRTQEF